MLKLGKQVGSRWDSLRKKTVRSFIVISDLAKPDEQAKEIALYVASVPSDKLRKAGDAPLYFSSTAKEGAELVKQGTEYRTEVKEDAAITQLKETVSIAHEMGISQAGLDTLILAKLQGA